MLGLACRTFSSSEATSRGPPRAPPTHPAPRSGGGSSVPTIVSNRGPPRVLPVSCHQDPDETRFLSFQPSSPAGLRAWAPQRPADLAGLGVKVALFDFNAELGEQLAAELGGVFCKVDVTRDDQVDAAFAKARAANGQERILVNCAGIGPAYKTASRDKKTGAISHFPIDKFEQTIQVNLIGSFRCAAKSAAGMLTLGTLVDEFNSGERGVIVNTASVAAQDGQVGQAAYSASKGGLLGVTLPMARDLMAKAFGLTPSCPASSRRRCCWRCLTTCSAPWRNRCPSRAAWQARRVRRDGGGYRLQQLPERRVHPPGRRHPHGAALKPSQGTQHG